VGLLFGVQKPYCSDLHDRGESGFDKSARGFSSQPSHLADDMKISNKNRKRIQEQLVASYGSAANYRAKAPGGYFLDETIPEDKARKELLDKAVRQYKEALEQAAMAYALRKHYHAFAHIWPTT
jgi:hypothetical protein